jgi:hypothetical protein
VLKYRELSQQERSNVRNEDIAERNGESSHDREWWLDLFVSCFHGALFFTLGTTLRLGCAFRRGDALLKFLLIDFLEKFATRIEEKVIKIVNSLSEGRVIHDLIAFCEHGIETVVEKCVYVGGNGTLNTSM